MAITQNATRVRVESAAKNGTLGTQGVLNADQIKFDTNISTNNSNLEATPTFEKRHVLIRKGTATQEINIVQSVDVDGVTCTMQQDWETAPASGDDYHVAYILDDVLTIAGLDYHTSSGQWYMDPLKRLIVGATTLPGFLGMSHGQLLRISDRSPDSGFRTGDEGIFCIGMVRNGLPNLGGMVMFENTTDNELCWDILGGARVYIYEFVLAAGKNPQGVNSLDVTVDALAEEVLWSKGMHYGIDSPFKETKIHTPIDGEGEELDVGDTVTWDGGTSTSTIDGFTSTEGHPFAKVILANGLVYNAHMLEKTV